MGSTGSTAATAVVAPSDAASKAACKDDSCTLEAKKPVEGADSTKKLKPCCACPETKKARDTCIVEKGEENCKDLIEAHKECMRKMGFKI